MKKRVFVTGYGLNCANGRNVQEFYQNCSSLQSGLKAQEQWNHLDCRIAGLVDTSDYTPSEIKEMNYYRAKRTIFTRHALLEALRQSKLKPNQVDEIGIYLGIDFYAGDEFMIDTFVNLYPQGKGEDSWDNFDLGYVVRQSADRITNKELMNVELLKSQMFFNYQNFMVDYLRSIIKIPGPSRTINNLCVSSAQAIGLAFQTIQNGEQDIIITGGLEEFSFISAFTFSKLGVYVKAKDPSSACVPFDVTRKGTVLGEGAAIVVLESEESMLKRGGEPLAEVLGYGTSNSCYHVTNSPSDGSGLAQSMGDALLDSGLSQSEIDVIVAHGTGTYINDLSESAAINKIFPSKPLVHSMKSYVGHTLSAAGGINFITALLEMKNEFVFPTLFLNEASAECNLNHVPKAGLQYPVKTSLINAAGFGGFNASLILKKLS
ncbi:MAG: beta-ketoacyl-[acyl-carrier-protein] synthase family protein [Candidatus Cloacimonetes bacterium]|nr:beta-ketoacyl-[acyl-carrier-protein] synthase family protein [Candidatus Cloacimonadota bacterium]